MTNISTVIINKKAWFYTFGFVNQISQKYPSLIAGEHWNGDQLRAEGRRKDGYVS